MTAVGQSLGSDREVLDCRPMERFRYAIVAGVGDIMGTMTWSLAHELFGHRPTTTGDDGKVVVAFSAKTPDTIVELGKLGRTLTKRGTDGRTFFDGTGARDGPAAAINGRLELLRGAALGFRNSASATPDRSWAPDSEPNCTFFSE